jgi:segregation and condensation protein B
MRQAPVAASWSSPTQGQLTPEQRSLLAQKRSLVASADAAQRTGEANAMGSRSPAATSEASIAGENGAAENRGTNGGTSGGSDGSVADPEDRLAARARIEAVLLIAKSPLNYRRLAALADVEDATSARTLVGELNELYDRLGRGIRIEQVAGGQRMMTRAVVAPWLRRLGFLAPAVRLSWPMMETLAVVAYRQDVTRADVEAVRGVACGEILRQLMQLDLVRISGRSEELGRPYLYGTTKRFLKICGLASIKSLPPIDWHASCDDVSQSADGEVENIADELKSRDPSQTESLPRRESSNPESSETNPSEPEHLHPTKESDVSVAAIETLATEFTVSPDADPSGGVAVLDAPASDADAALSNDPSAVIEDEEDDLYENGFDLDDEEDEDFDDDDWDDEDEDSDDDEDDEEEDDDSDDLDDEDEDDDDLDGTDDWEEVDDDEADEDWDDEDEEDGLDEEDEEWED